MSLKAKVICTEINQVKPSQKCAILTVVSGSDFSTGKSSGGIVMFIDGNVPAEDFFKITAEGEQPIEYEINFSKIIT